MRRGGVRAPPVASALAGAKERNLNTHRYSAAASVWAGALLLAFACAQLRLGPAPTVAAASAPPLAARYRLDAAQSHFMVRTFSGGLLWFTQISVDGSYARDLLPGFREMPKPVARLPELSLPVRSGQ